MKYVVDIIHYTEGSGYNYTETFDSGASETFFTAEEWYNGLDVSIELIENEWIEIEILFYDDGDDPMFSNQIVESKYCVVNY